MSLEAVTHAIDRADARLRTVSPYALLLAVPATYCAAKVAKTVLSDGIGPTCTGVLRKVLWMFPSVRTEYQKKIDQQEESFKESAQKKWEKFGPPVTSLPEEGMSYNELAEMIARYQGCTTAMTGKQQYSGAIYSSSLREGDDPAVTRKMMDAIPLPTDPAEKSAAELKRLYVLAFQASYLWNSLHGNEFAVGQFINYQLVQIVASRFRGRSEEIAGFVTSGGTESLMTAARGYVQWGVAEKGLKVEDCVIVVPHSIHAAMIKAQQASGFKLIQVPTDRAGGIDFEAFERVCQKHRHNLVAIFGSAPSYATGRLDPIRDMGLLARELKCGFHVDCCLGGFVVEDLEGLDNEFLDMQGVTSLSADPHKNGLAPKGCSVLPTKKMPFGRNLAHYCVYAIPGWDGGIYGTPTTAGSQSSMAAFGALISALKMGKKGYKDLATLIYSVAKCLGQAIDSVEGLRLLGPVEVNVVAFEMDRALAYEKGAIYGFTSLMEKRGFTCSNISDDRAHFCVTKRFADHKGVVESFRKAAIECMSELKGLNESKKKHGTQFPGEAALYGEIGAALEPKKAAMSLSKYMESLLFGESGANDAVRAYFVAHSNPWLIC